MCLWKYYILDCDTFSSETYILSLKSVTESLFERANILQNISIIELHHFPCDFYHSEQVHNLRLHCFSLHFSLHFSL